MPRTDENGRQLKALLDYLLDGDVDAKDIYDALGVSSSTYYRRIKEEGYPDAEELRRVADRFELSYPDLQVRFGLMSHEEVLGLGKTASIQPQGMLQPFEGIFVRAAKSPSHGEKNCSASKLALPEMNSATTLS